MLKNILNTFVNCFKIPELKSRIFFTLIVLGICRLVSMLPLPNLDGQALAEYFEKMASKDGGGLLGMYSMFTGGALERCAIGSLGIMPYISATIIIQLLSAVIPQLSKLAREEGGRAKIIQYGRYLTVLLCLGQGLVMAIAWENPEKIFTGFAGQLVADPGWGYRLETTLLLTTGTLLMMWLGEQISERGIGNGVSLVITVGILARLPQTVQALIEMFFPPEGVEARFHYMTAFVLVGLLLLVIAAVIAVTQAQRKIPVQYAQRMMGRKMVQGGSSFMPLKVNYAGVMPIIFAQAILMFPEKLLGMLGQSLDLKFLVELSTHFREDQFMHMLLFAAMILFFSYFWVATQFNEVQIADDLKKYGGYIPGVRPGQATSDYLHHTMSRITLAGAIFLMIIAIIPQLMSRSLGINYYVAQFFGGTSLLITVGVVLDTMRMMESHLLMRHYDGFLSGGKGGKGPRLKGRF
ncbi:MAG: preprotein translocase subunit SecY [Verrucomicrobia bacterium]|nr:preprotein translocase subunit SecY [Verrucomicrobiota bacterium]NBU11046.1 preprotein translocase subunit SecY [Pseudomonadota bacterium]NDA65604.1 preprotein translocase subunit SecY [Verrucomicrobiota bacterium]NDB75082.1 preprotein translocase subunit SecY [Verrucomicrobiota bacterium]NDD38131.1 preprotein translocase subunit SecY [Verrucomicrobiota bacterium]